MKPVYNIDKRLVGHVGHECCKNPSCKKHIAEGRTWHAVPIGFAVTLDTYHFATREEAEAALIRKWYDMSVTVAADRFPHHKGYATSKNAENHLKRVCAKLDNGDNIRAFSVTRRTSDGRWVPVVHLKDGQWHEAFFFANNNVGVLAKE